MGMFSQFGEVAEVTPPGPKEALEAAKIGNRELERQDARKVPPAPLDLAQMVSRPPEVTQERLATFLSELALVPNKPLAALRAGLLLSQVRRVERESPDFAAAVEMAIGIAGGLAEEEAFRRSIKGVTKAVYHQGRVVGTEQLYSDALMAKVLEAHVPSFERRQKVDANVSGQLNWLQMVQVVLNSDR